MEFIVWVLHLLAAATVVGLVLLQHGKGADMGAAFGSGSSGSLFGATGSANFLSRTTAVVATVFFLTSLGLTFFSTQKHMAAKPQAQPVQPVAPLPAPPVGGGLNKAGDIPK
ncbi:MAG TPA: preprotein translocase subunit SecG [Thiobacillaceae bacterium]|nr:preprotein translocase subunit SecG [Thiobacillaceae bacterium]HNA82458.1 preprotein translocase subunit SecG [Thiobacillaceae bacterium]HNF89614.1 preprotein translocase subunit SecG [Thiobacillaceae bacterium]HNH88704.1 preprotein translocase subunit SecG [Thiobacillaceae bacterium]HNI07302.1 preprotein translocase subunit SecG [Thiobacillaceae bacterium]